MSILRRNFMKLLGLSTAVPVVVSACTATKTSQTETSTTTDTKQPDAPKATKTSITEIFPAWTEKPYIHWSGHVSLYSANTSSRSKV